MDSRLDREREPIRGERDACADRKRYEHPVLARYGNVRDITLAPTPGTFESGRGSGFRADATSSPSFTW
jgi:hypothetical protein